MTMMITNFKREYNNKKYNQLPSSLHDKREVAEGKIEMQCFEQSIDLRNNIIVRHIIIHYTLVFLHRKTKLICEKVAKLINHLKQYDTQSVSLLLCFGNKYENIRFVNI